MKVTKITEIDAVHCVAETSEGEKHMITEDAKKLMAKPKAKAKPKKKAENSGSK